MFNLGSCNELYQPFLLNEKVLSHSENRLTYVDEDRKKKLISKAVFHSCRLAVNKLSLHVMHIALKGCLVA